jgi:hypothetical protein
VRSIDRHRLPTRAITISTAQTAAASINLLDPRGAGPATTPQSITNEEAVHGLERIYR